MSNEPQEECKEAKKSLCVSIIEESQRCYDKIVADSNDLPKEIIAYAE